MDDRLGEQFGEYRLTRKLGGILMDDFDRDKVDEVVHALMYLTLHDGDRAWKGFDWDTLDRLHEKGFIGDPKNKAKSVWLTQEGLEMSERLFEQYFGK